MYIQANQECPLNVLAILPITLHENYLSLHSLIDDFNFFYFINKLFSLIIKMIILYVVVGNTTESRSQRYVACHVQYNVQFNTCVSYKKKCMVRIKNEEECFAMHLLRTSSVLPIMFSVREFMRRYMHSRIYTRKPPAYISTG